MIVDVLALLLLVLVPFDWFVAFLLIYVSKLYPTVLALRERAFAAVISAIVATIAGILGWVRLGALQIPNGAALFLIALGLILVSIPSLYWLYLLLSGRWRLDGRE